MLVPPMHLFPQGVYTGIVHGCMSIFGEDRLLESGRNMGNEMERETRWWLAQLQNADETRLHEIERTLSDKRISWFTDNRDLIDHLGGDYTQRAYELLLLKIGADPEEVPVVERTHRRIVFHSRNFCPSLEACRKLHLDTRYVCKVVLERPADLLVKQLHPDLVFSRNYDRIRPHTNYCEEMISLMPGHDGSAGDRMMIDL
jgi:hypothetical protein